MLNQGKTIGEVAGGLGITETTWYHGESTHMCVKSSDVKPLKGLGQIRYEGSRSQGRRW
jgi:hypothetical protein